MMPRVGGDRKSASAAAGLAAWGWLADILRLLQGVQEVVGVEDLGPGQAFQPVQGGPFLDD